MWSPTAKKCVLDKPKSCKEMLDLKQLPDIPAGKVRIDKDVRLWPDVVNKPDHVVSATCHIIREPDGEDFVKLLSTKSVCANGNWGDMARHAADLGNGKWDYMDCQRMLQEDPKCSTEFFGLTKSNGHCWCVQAGDKCTERKTSADWYGTYQVKTTVKAYTTIKCDDLTGGDECVGMVLVNVANSCTKSGYIAGPPRSALHIDALRPLWDEYFQLIPGLSIPNNVDKLIWPWTCAMRSASDPKKATAKKYCNMWKAVDGGAWFIRDDPWEEPSGSYCANTLLHKGTIHAYTGTQTRRCYDRSRHQDFCKKEDARVIAAYNPCSPTCTGSGCRRPEQLATTCAYYWDFTTNSPAKDFNNYVVPKYHKCHRQCAGIRPQHGHFYKYYTPKIAYPACDNLQSAKDKGTGPSYKYICSTKDY